MEREAPKQPRPVIETKTEEPETQQQPSVQPEEDGATQKKKRPSKKQKQRMREALSNTANETEQLQKEATAQNTSYRKLKPNVSPEWIALVRSKIGKSA